MPAPRRVGLVARPVPAPVPAPAATAASPATPAAAPTVAVPAPVASALNLATALRIPVVLTATNVRGESDEEPAIYKSLGKGGAILIGSILLFGAVMLIVLLITWAGLIGTNALLQSLLAN